MVTSIFAAGLMLGEKQDLTFWECIKFAEALECEFDIMVCVGGMSYEDAEEYLEFMWGFRVKKEEPKDDFIVGKVNEMHFPYTIISSEETIPHKFYGKEVEIRLKEIVKKPEKFKYEQTSVVRLLGHWSKDSGEYCTNGNIQAELKKCVGKKVKITIEEVE
jgi:hypothetical protein